MGCGVAVAVQKFEPCFITQRVHYGRTVLSLLVFVKPSFHFLPPTTRSTLSKLRNIRRYFFFTDGVPYEKFETSSKPEPSSEPRSRFLGTNHPKLEPILGDRGPVLWGANHPKLEPILEPRSRFGDKPLKTLTPFRRTAVPFLWGHPYVVTAARLVFGWRAVTHSPFLSPSR